MYDAGKIIAGLITFLALVTFPLWYNQAGGEAASKPELKIEAGQRKCVEPKEYMRVFHMQMLNEWRDLAVRDGNKVYVASDGETYEMSLSNTCMNCHPNRQEFCQQCHDYVGVNPYFWDCHVEPKESAL